MAFIEQFHFLRPLWFVALIPLILLYWLIKQRVNRHSGWQSIVASHLYRFMVTEQGKAVSRPPFWMLAVGWILAVTALAGPTWEKLPQPVFQVKAGHVIVMDMSLSMRATDLTPDRLTRAKYKAMDLVNATGEGEMGLVAYAGDAFTISPLTTDAANLTALIPSLSPEIMPVPGSDPFLGIKSAAELLANAGYQKGHIYWFTDEIEFSQTKELQNYLNEQPYEVNLLGVGTPSGAPIKQLNGELLKEADGSIVIAKLNDAPLRAIAQAGNGIYTPLTTTDGDIEALLAAIDRPQQKATEDNKNTAGDKWREFGPYLVLLLLPLACYGFRRGLVACFAFSLMISTPAPVSAQQEESGEGSQSPWYSAPFANRDQRGLAAFQNDAYSQAASEFESAAWKGAAHYKAGEYEEALQAFSQDNSAEGLYNQGNSLAQLGELDKAIEKYAQALTQQPDHKDAANNKALLEAMKKQQEQEQQQQKENPQQQQEDQQNKQDQQQSKDQQENSQQTDENDSSKPSQRQQDTSPPSQSDEQHQNESQQSESKQQQVNQQQQSAEPQQSEQSDGETERSEKSEQAIPTAQSDALSDEEKQRLENIKRRIPDDPAYLLKRKMQLEAQRRQRDRLPANRRDW
ncbi:vWA domain-containing protein [Alteromonas ponticola]|uniref:VWA domain-containing protein n=1 Tax=Alteromonas ponticola TaxID=2720613 RepID=A0ABX1R1J2_9ALTE|nr:VWA domain-containing protein [Alteromonas ponticola]NMH59476.1 VWA domain-containing protein [Alteromonas ponticola]